MELTKLKDVFHPDDIEWRVSRAGHTNGKTWAFVLAYVTNRAIMNRLDDVCSPENWKNEFLPAPNGGTLCGISIKINDEWVTKWDGSDNTAFEAVKGGLSGAMKRAAVQWGIGRYLYQLPEMFAIVNENGKHYQTADGKGKYPAFKWDEPELPGWALPQGMTEKHGLPKSMTAPPMRSQDETAVIMAEVLEMIKKSGLPDSTFDSLRKKYKTISKVEDAMSLKTEIEKILMVKSTMLDGFEDDQIPWEAKGKGEIPLL